MPRRSSIGAAADRAFGFTGGLSKPSNTVAPVVSGTTVAGNSLSCTTGTWTGNPTSYSYQWQRNNTTNVGSNTSTYSLTTADVGFTINCVVTATNPGGTTSANSNSTTAITSAPVNTGAPSVTGTARVASVLTCSTGTWSYSPTAYSYQWKRGGSTNIGTNANTYTCVSGDVGSTISCVVTASNASGSANATSNSTGAVVTNTYTITYLIVAGGGGGGTPAGGNNAGGAGGGAGGVIYSSFTATIGTNYAVVNGGGGGGGGAGGNGGNGGYAYINTIAGATGGGGGANTGGGNAGGSGGGAGAFGGYSSGGGTAGQGNRGGYAVNAANYNGDVGGYPNGGGGGLGSAGGDVYDYTQNAGIGGYGYGTGITGGYQAVAGGGGGSRYWYSGNAGGNAGGGAGANFNDYATSATAGTGSGGGGGGSGLGVLKPGGNGAHGQIVMRIPTGNWTGAQSGAAAAYVNGADVVVIWYGSGSYTA